MSAIDAPRLSVVKPAPGPSATERRLTWAAIFVFLAAFWYGAAVGVTALWGAVTG